MNNPQDTAAQRATRIATDWLKRFNAALAADDASALHPLFIEDCHWRDLLALTWKFGTVSGREHMAHALLRAVQTSAAHTFELDPQRLAPRTLERAGEMVIEAMVRFKTKVGVGSGLVRLRDPVDERPVARAWTLLTALHAIDGYDEETVRLSREEAPYARDPQAANWLERRRKALRYEERDPTVLIVGGGHAGLGAAAALKALGIETLIVDRTARIGDNWRLRYHTLKLHNMTPSNHMPYLPFPAIWPNYIAKDKIANWFECYVEALELDFWTNTTFAGATYDQKSGRWAAMLKRQDGSVRTMHPAHIVIATSVSGTPNVPVIPTLEKFTGPVVHSSKFKHGAQWRDKDVLVFGTGTSAHDIAQALYGHGARVAMVQRNPTEVVGIEPSAQLYDGIFYEDGVTIADKDFISASIPLKVLKQSHALLTKKAREHDAPLHARLQRVGFKLDMDAFGWPLKFRRFGGRYYFNVGCSDLIADGRIKLVQTEDINTFTTNSLVLKDRREIAVDLVVLATGYKGLDVFVENLFGQETAQRIGPVWDFDAQTQELRNMWHKTGQPGLWLTGGSFSQCRIFSKYLAMQIQASELGLLR